MDGLEKKELILASKNGHMDAVRYLLDKGADIIMMGENGETALIKASCYGHIDVVRCLLDSGADVNKQNKNGVTALILALPYSETVDVLLVSCQKGVPLECGQAMDRAISESKMKVFFSILAHYLIFECASRNEFIVLAEMFCKPQIKSQLHSIIANVLEAMYVAGCPESLIDEIGRRTNSSYCVHRMLTEMGDFYSSLQKKCCNVVRCRLIRTRRVNKVDQLPLPVKIIDQFQEICTKIRHLCRVT